MIPNDKQLASLIKKIQKKVDANHKKRVEKQVQVEEIEVDSSVEIFEEMKKKPYTS